MKQIFKSLGLSIVVAVVLFAYPLASHAASGSISCIPTVIEEGQTSNVVIAANFSEKSSFRFSMASSNSSVLAVPSVIFNSFNDYPQGTTGATYMISVTGVKAGEATLMVQNGDAATFPTDPKINPVAFGISGSCQITVVAKKGDKPAQQKPTPQQPNQQKPAPNPAPSQEPRVKSSNTELTTLQVDQGVLSPAFSQDQREYTVDLDSDVTSVKVSVWLAHDKSKVEGNDRINLHPGVNKHTVTVTAEDGTKGYYTITFNVKTKDLSFDLDGKRLTLVEDVDGLSMSGYTKTKIKVQETEVVVFKSTDKTLIYLQDEQGHKALYHFDQEAEKPTSKLEVLSINDHFYEVLPLMDKPFDNLVVSDLMIQDQKVSAYRFEDPNLSNLAVLRLKAFGGQDQSYLYDEKLESLVELGNHTLVNSDQWDLLNKPRLEEKPQENKSDVLLTSLLWLGLAVLSLLSIILSVALLKKSDLDQDQDPKDWDWYDPIREEKLKKDKEE